jgi:hypothetical protein
MRPAEPSRSVGRNISSEALLFGAICTSRAYNKGVNLSINSVNGERLALNAMNKHLLVRADFVLGRCLGGDRPTYRRWRRILIEALPRLLGCGDRCSRAERVRLRKGDGEARFVGWVRIPVERRPGRKRYRKLKAALRARLEANLRPLDGEVIKVGVRRQWRRPVVLPLSVEPDGRSAA